MKPPILSAIEGKRLIRNHAGDLVEIDEWSHDLARERARAEGLELTGDHFRVLDALRDYAIEHEGSRQEARQILREMERRFKNDGGRRWLFKLFPGGPVRQGMRLAGLPEAPYDEDPAFGSVI